MTDIDIDGFARGLRGSVVRKGDPDYDNARKLYNGMFDKHPRFIVRCADAADVIAAVKLARDSGLPLAVRGGGHNGAGLGSVDDGIVLDMSQINDVRIDPKAGTVRVGAGCTTGQVDHATYAFGLAIPFGIISTTGVAGLTLSGGHGHLEAASSVWSSTTLSERRRRAGRWPLRWSRAKPETPICSGL